MYVCMYVCVHFRSDSNVCVLRTCSGWVRVCSGSAQECQSKETVGMELEVVSLRPRAFVIPNFLSIFEVRQTYIHTVHTYIHSIHTYLKCMYVSMYVLQHRISLAPIHTYIHTFIHCSHIWIVFI